MKRKVISLITWYGEHDDPRYVIKGRVYEGEFEPKYKEMLVITRSGHVALREGEYEEVSK